MFKFRRTNENVMSAKGRESFQDQFDTKLNNSFMGEKSVDYANYLIDIQSERDSFILSASNPNLLKPVQTEILNFDDLKQNKHNKQE